MPASPSTGKTMDALAIVEAFGAAWVARDLDETLLLVTDDCVFESTEPGPDGIRYKGRDSLRRAWQPIFDDKDAVFEAEETFATPDRVVQRWRYSWRGGHVRGIDVFRTRDGLVAEKLSYVKG
jgi:ketosteroid isomerase-like protein